MEDRCHTSKLAIRDFALFTDPFLLRFFEGLRRASMSQSSISLHYVVGLHFVLLWQARAFAAPDDVEPLPPADIQVNAGFMMDEANFDQWVFQGSGNAAAGRARIDSQLKLKLDELNRVCDLSDEQRKKLTLAARGDMKRFFDQVEEVRRKFVKVKNDPNGFNNVWQEINPLQQKQSAGLFGDNSLFGKTVRRTLTDEQRIKYQAVVEERRQFRYRAAIEVSLHTLANTVALRHEQHEALIKLLVEETQPPYLFGQMDNYVVMYKMAGLPPEKLKPLFDDRQWKLLQQQFIQARGMESHLVQGGFIDQPKGGILKSVKTFIDGAGLGAPERANAVKDGDDAPADAVKPEQRRKGAEQ